MPSLFDTALLLCHCLSLDDSVESVGDLRRSLGAGDVDWPALVDIANQQLVTPALWSSLCRKRCATQLPADLRSYLAEIHARNAHRNTLIRRQACDAVAALNANGVVPVVLKGGLHLFDGGFDAAARMMTDVDLLVAGTDITASQRALAGLGYAPPRRSWENPSHAWTLYRPGAIATLDLHRDLGPQRSILTTDEAMRAAVRLSENGLRLNALCPTHGVLHTVINTAIIEQNHRAGRICLRPLHDLALLCRRHPASIDWAAIDAAMAGSGCAHVLHGTLHLANHVLGLPLPAGTRRGRLHLSRCLLQLRHRRLMVLAQSWARVAHPLNRVRMDYLYGCGRSRLRLYESRLRHAGSVLRRRGGKMIERRWSEVRHC